MTPTALPSDAQPLINEDSAAQRLGLSAASLQKDRQTRALGIPFVKIGAAIRYRVSDLDKFVADRVVL